MEDDPGKVVIAGVQMDCRIARKRENLEALEARAREAASRGARLVVFPECALTGYLYEDLREALEQAETIPGPATEAMGRICRELGIHAVFGLIEQDGGRIFNSLAFVGPEGLVGAGYRKIHLPVLGLDRFAAPGDRPFEVHGTPLGRIGLNICYDAGFPESSRILALRGADLIALPTNWPPGAEGIAEHAVIARALENTVYYIAANRVGEERGTRFIGRSSMVDPLGKVLAAAGPEGEEILLAEIEPARARAKRIERGPGNIIDRIGHRRPEFYGPIAEAPAPGPERPDRPDKPDRSASPSR